MEAPVYIILIGFALLIAFFMAKPLSEFAYAVSKNWKLGLFVGACVLSVISATLYVTHAQAGSYRTASTFTSPFSNFMKGRPSEGQIEMAIHSCKEFIGAKASGHEYNITHEASSYYRPTTEAAMWHTCSEVFGQNYWRYDISINGENGGHLLCRMYKEQDRNAAATNSWCETVFSAAQQQASAPRPTAQQVTRLSAVMTKAKE
jgi:hypothetical protein